MSYKPSLQPHFALQNEINPFFKVYSIAESNGSEAILASCSIKIIAIRVLPIPIINHN
jgi:hypothetical protein